jgi:hypothetical protein
MKQLTDQSTEKLFRRTSLIQFDTGALTRDAASLSAFIATGGNSDYSRRFGAAAAALAEKGHTPDQLAQRLETMGRSRGAPGLQRDHARDHPEIALDLNREFPL